MKAVLVLVLVLVLGALPAVSQPLPGQIVQWITDNYMTFTCRKNCTIPASSWGATTHLCTDQGEFANNLCTNTQSFANCVASSAVYGFSEYNWTVVSPGTCSCPSDCTGRGTCSSKCECLAGYTGDDCSLISCSSKQQCSLRGTCKGFEELGIESCECESGFSLGDCSAEMVPLPDVPNLLSVPQYSDWDQYGDNHPIFNSSEIAQIYLTISPEDLAFLIDPLNQNERVYKHANFSFYNGAVTQRIEDVGMRIKGGASRSFAKKSWKISFNTFSKGRTWGQQKKINLKDASMDPSYVRELASLSALKAMGGPAQRGSYAVVYINDRVWGLYLLLEDPATDEYLKSRFGNAKGSLWKCQGTLEYISDNPDDYRDDLYTAENDNAEADYTPLANFISVLNETPDDQFEEKIQTVMNVEFFLRTYAFEVATGNFDGIYNANNYFLYYNTDGLFYYYRHDLDISFGFMDFWYHFADRSIWEWCSVPPQGRGHLLPDRILAVPSFQEIFASYLSKATAYVSSDGSGTFRHRVQALHNSIHSAVEMDAWHSLDNGMYSKRDYEVNLEQPVTRPNFLPPNPFWSGPKWEPFSGFFEFTKLRDEATAQQLKSGPAV